MPETDEVFAWCEGCDCKIFEDGDYTRQGHEDTIELFWCFDCLDPHESPLVALLRPFARGSAR